MSSSRAKQVRRAALVTSTVVVALLGWAGPAAAQAGTVSGVVATGGGRINVRSGPSTSERVVTTRPDGSRLVLLCQVKGEKIRRHPPHHGHVEQGQGRRVRVGRLRQARQGPAAVHQAGLGTGAPPQR